MRQFPIQPMAKILCGVGSAHIRATYLSSSGWGSNLNCDITRNIFIERKTKVNPLTSYAIQISYKISLSWAMCLNCIFFLIDFWVVELVCFMMILSSVENSQSFFSTDSEELTICIFWWVLYITITHSYFFERHTPWLSWTAICKRSLEKNSEILWLIEMNIWKHHLLQLQINCEEFAITKSTPHSILNTIGRTYVSR
jgi:hypothetical protein